IVYHTPNKLYSIPCTCGSPLASKFHIQYTTIDYPTNLSFNPPGMCKDFPHGVVDNGRGVDPLIRLSLHPVQARFVRIVMTETSGPTAIDGRDIRDELGYAMREVYAGRWTGGKLTDEVRH